jgi:hypothetical protein
MGCYATLLSMLATILTMLGVLLGGVEQPPVDAPMPTPSPTPTPTPPGDIGFRAIAGTVSLDSAEGLIPAVGAQVHYEHYSMVRDGTSGSTTTDRSGHFAFDPILIHDTDSITVWVELPGYEPHSILWGALEIYFGSGTFDFVLTPKQPTNDNRG